MEKNYKAATEMTRIAQEGGFYDAQGVTAEPARSVPTVEQVEQAVGYSSLAWDCIDPAHLIATVVRLATPAASAQPAVLSEATYQNMSLVLERLDQIKNCKYRWELMELVDQAIPCAVAVLRALLSANAVTSGGVPAAFDLAALEASTKIIALTREGKHDTQLKAAIQCEIVEAMERVAAPAAPLTVPQGWKLVPVEPTEDMLHEGDMHMEGLSRLSDAWDAMLAAAPAAPASGQAAEGENA